MARHHEECHGADLYRLLPAIGSGGRRGRGCREGAGEGLVHLKGLTNLQSLTLMGRFDNSSQITDAGLVHLKGMTELQTLDLAFTKTALWASPT